MYFKRDIDKKLLKHFSQENPTPLIVRGAPDVGKFTSLLNLTGNFKIAKVIDLTDFKSRSNIKFNSKLEPRNVGTDDYTQLEFLIQSETGEEFLEDPNNLLILRNADHVFGLLSIVSRLGKYNNCKIAVTVISPHFFGDTSYLVTDLTIIGMKTMTIKEFSKAYNTYRTSDMGASHKDVFKLYKQCGGFPRCLEAYLDPELEKIKPKYIIINYVYNFAKYFGYNYEVIFDFLTAFTRVALAQNFIFTDIAFDLTNYLERTYFNYAFKYEQVREILAELINYGILAKKPIYDMQKGNDTEYYTLHFTDILFHNYFIQSILCTEKAKAAADLTFYIYDARRAGCLTKDKNTFLRKCNDDVCYESNTSADINKYKDVCYESSTSEDIDKCKDVCFSPDYSINVIPEVLFMLQKTKSEERTFITFSKEMENALLEKYSDSRVLRYSKKKIHKLYGLKKKKK